MAINWFQVYLFVASLYISYATRPKPFRPKPPIFDEFKFPQAEEGTPQCVVFGDSWIEDWMVLGVSNYRTKAIKKKSGKK